MSGTDATAALEAFLRDLALAWKNLATYPPGHPALRGSVARAHAQLAPLIDATGELRLGVAEGKLRWVDEKIDSLPAQRLAQALHRRQVAVLSFREGLGRTDLERFLRLLATEPRGGIAARLDEEIEEAGLAGVHAEPIDYSALRLTDEPEPPQEDLTGESLVERIVRELLAGRRLGLEDENGELLAARGAPDEMARLVERLLASIASREASGEGDAVLLAPESLGDAGESAAERSSRGQAEAEAGLGAVPGTAPLVFGESASPTPGGGRSLVPGLLGEGIGNASVATGTGAGSRKEAETGSGSGQAKRRAALAATLARLVRESLGPDARTRRPESLGQLISLLRALPADLRAPLLDAALAALAGVDGDAEALRQLAAALPAAEVLRAFRRLADQKFRFSPLAVRVAQALAAAAREDSSKKQQATDARAITAALRTLFADDDVDRFGAGGQHRAESVTLPRIVAPESAPPEITGLRETLEPEAIDRHLTIALLELLESPLARQEGIAPVLEQLHRLFRQAIEDGRPRAATEILDRQQALASSPLLDELSREAIRRSLERFGTRENVLALVGALATMAPAAIEQSKALIARLGGPAIRHLLAGLAEERDRSRRHQLLEFACSLGRVVGPEAAALLGDARWFVVRNALVILRRIEDRDSVPAVRKCAEHPDLRVRLEAIRSLFTFENEMPRQLLEQALRDPDPKLVDSAIALAARRGFRQAVDPLVALLLPWDPFGRRRALRVRAWWALGQIGDPGALERLRRFFRPGLIKKDHLDERRAAFRALAGFDPPDRAPWVELGLKARDAQIRNLCQRLAADRGARAAASEELDNE